MTRAMRISLAGAAVVLAADFQVLGQPTDARPVTAILVTVEGRVELLKSGSRTSRRLDPRRDALLALRPGDQLKCFAAGRAVISFNGVDRPVERCANGYVLPPPEPKVATVFSEYGRTGGLPRGGFAGLVMWPVEGIRARAHTLSQVEWRPQQTGTIALLLRGGSPLSVVWMRSDIDATTGRVQDPDLEAALKGLAARGELTPILEVRPRVGPPVRVPLALMNSSEDLKLQAQLDNVASDAERPVVHLLRADVLLKARLPREALDEYVAALDAHPDATALLEKAAAVASSLGDPRAVGLIERAEATQLGQGQGQ